MNKLLLQSKYFTITTRKIAIAFVVVILLLFGLSRCGGDTKASIKAIAISNIEEFPKRNFNDLMELLNRVDLCSDQWFKDCDDYISRLEEQNDLLINKKGKDYQRIYQVQTELLAKLKAFREKQNDETIGQLEIVFNEYKEAGVIKNEVNSK